MLATFPTHSRCTWSVSSLPSRPFPRPYTLSSSRTGTREMPQLSVLIANSSAGLKHNKSTEKPGGMNCPDASISDNEKAVVRSLRATGGHAPSLGVGC